MYHIKTFNSISPVGLKELPPERFGLDDGQSENGILVRSADLHNYEFPDTLRAIARAGAGTNNIPIDRCSEAGIVVFNTPGANANAVKELAVCGLILASRDIIGGSTWVWHQAKAGVNVPEVVEKGKSAFIGPEVMGKTLGVMGLGAVGVQVANIATKLGMTVYGYDPFLSVDHALMLSRLVHRAMDLKEIYRNCDYITLHLPLLDSTRHIINAKSLAQMKDGVRILNLARGELVDDEAMVAALDEGKVARYVTDFPNNVVTRHKNVVPIPHLGASSPESEENCAVMAAQQLRDYLENGNIRNSVNLPDLEQEWSGQARLCIIHRNIPNMIASITTRLSQDGVNVETLSNRAKGEYAYTIVDLSSTIDPKVEQDICAMEGILLVRLLKR